MSKQKSFLNGPAIRLAFRTLMFGEEGTAGAVLVEATLMVPMLVVMSIYVMDFGLVFYNKMEMQNAAQAGAQWAVANRVYNSSEIQVAAQNATKLPASQITVSSSQFCGCSKDSSGNAVVTQLTATACTSAPNTTCNTSGVEGNYVTVTASPTSTYQTFFSYGLLSGTLSTPNISATTTVRIQ
jgi:Flp pilus assembly protein TadG